MALKVRKSRAPPPPKGCPMSACMALLGGAWTTNLVWQLSGLSAQRPVEGSLDQGQGGIADQRAEQAQQVARIGIGRIAVEEADDLAGGRVQRAPHRVALAAGGAEVIVRRENPGFGAACNLGLERVREDVAVLLNPDTELEPQCLERLLKRAVVLDPRIGSGVGSEHSR